MLRTITVILLLAITAGSLQAQSRSSKTLEIDRYAYDLDSSNSKNSSWEFVMDSINVKVMTYPGKIETTSYFTRSKSILTIDYYSRCDDLVLIKIKEHCRAMDDMYKLTDLYFENNKIFNENYSWTIRSCLPLPADLDMDKYFGYNKSLGIDFLRGYTARLLGRIRLQPIVNSLANGFRVMVFNG